MIMRTTAQLVSGLLLTGFLQQATAALELPAQPRPTSTTAAARLGTSENNLGLAKGAVVPAFAVHTFAGKPVTLAALLHKAPLMIIFYRGGWCPYCNYQIRQLTRAYDKFRQRKVLPVLISVDKPDAATLVQQSYRIPFPVLSDPKLAALNAFNVAIDVDKKVYARYKNHGLDLEEWSGQKHHKIAAPAIFLLNQQGKVLWSHVARDYKTRPDIEQLLNVIDATLD